MQRVCCRLLDNVVSAKEQSWVSRQKISVLAVERLFMMRFVVGAASRAVARVCSEGRCLLASTDCPARNAFVVESGGATAVARRQGWPQYKGQSHLWLRLDDSASSSHTIERRLLLAQITSNSNSFPQQRKRRKVAYHLPLSRCVLRHYQGVKNVTRPFPNLGVTQLPGCYVWLVLFPTACVSWTPSPTPRGSYNRSVLITFTRRARGSTPCGAAQEQEHMAVARRHQGSRQGSIAS